MTKFFNYFLNLLSKFFDSLIKFVLYLITPIIIGYEKTSELQLFIALIFLSSVIFRFSSEIIFLKKLSDLNLNLKKFNLLIYQTLILFSKSYFVFFIILFALYKFAKLFINIQIYEIIENYYIYIFLNSLTFSFVAIVAFSLRALGRPNLSILFFGSIWPSIIIILLIIESIFNYGMHFIIKNFTIYFLLIGISISIYFFYFVNHKFVFKKYEKKYTKLKTDRLNSYIQSIGSIFINWVPIIIFSFYNDKISSGIFATYFKFGLGLLYFINVVDLISAKKLSYYFQIKNKIKLKKTYNEFKVLKIISAIMIFFLSYIFFKIYDHYFSSANIEYTLFLYIALILLCGFFGPIDISFLLFNKEKLLAKNNIFLIISIIIILNLTCQYFGILGSLISFSIILLINYTYKYFILKKLNYV